MRGFAGRVVGAVVAMAPALPTAQERSWDTWGMHPMWGMWGVWTVWGFAMLLVMLVFWGLVIAGLVVGLRWLLRLGGPPRHDAALDILRERYARGEIGREEFEAKQRDLG